MSANDHAHIELLKLIVEYYGDPEAWVQRWSNTASRHALIERLEGTPEVAAALATEDFVALLDIGAKTVNRTTIDVVHGPGFSDQYAGNNVYLSGVQAQWTDAADDSAWQTVHSDVLPNKAGRRFRFAFTVFAPPEFAFAVGDPGGNKSFEMQLTARRYSPDAGAALALVEIPDNDDAHRWGSLNANGLGAGVARTFGHPEQDGTGLTIRIGFADIAAGGERGSSWTLTTPALELSSKAGAPLVNVMLNADFLALNYVSPAGSRYEGAGPMAHRDSIKAVFSIVAA
jgi:hypothetical protein